MAANRVRKRPAKGETAAPTAAATSTPTIKRVNLALQGGGAHGAFAWGVLDRLLEDGRLEFDAVSATSAGAMNATALAYGLTVGGREGPRPNSRSSANRRASRAFISARRRVASSRNVLMESWSWATSDSVRICSPISFLRFAFSSANSSFSYSFSK